MSAVTRVRGPPWRVEPGRGTAPSEDPGPHRKRTERKVQQMLRRLLRKTERCAIRDCDKPAVLYALVAATGGLDPERVELAGFCSDEHADRVPRPSARAIERVRAARARRVT